MVDCIVPATTDQVLSQCRALGIDDRAPVTHENFRQWVIEDDFCAGRPDWEQVGVTMTNNVHAYEAMKLRILNGGHQLLANVGEILNVETISDCMQDKQISEFFHKIQREEILPQVTPVPGTSPAEYLDQVTRRFSNTAIHDTTRRVAFDGSSRHPGFLLPSQREALASGASVTGLALAAAFWARMCAGTREDGTEVRPNDPIWSILQKAALDAKETPQCWIDQTGLYADVGHNTRFAQEFSYWLPAIWEKGCRATMDTYLRGSHHV